MASPTVTAKQILAANEAVLFGIFGLIRNSGYFPPRQFLNEFLKVGYDPCDQDGRMERWQPFAISPEEYNDVQSWWIFKHPGAVISDLGAKSWGDWLEAILNPDE